MRDEAPYVLEWLAFYRAIGISDFLIYTNDCRDGTDLIMDRLEQNGEITHERTVVLKRGPQKSAYKSAMRHQMYKDAEWVLACDVDEFLNIKVGDGMVSDLIAKYREKDVIPVAWRMFSNNGREDFIDGFTVKALTDAEPEDGPSVKAGHFVKSIFKPHPEIIRIGAHAPVFSDEFMTKVTWGAAWIEHETYKNPTRPVDNMGYDTAQMNHYAVRSINPFLIKRDRGDVASRPEKLEIAYWERWCQGSVFDDSILRLLPLVQNEYDRLMRDPVLKHLQLAGIEWHQERLKLLLKDKSWQGLKQAILTHPSTQVSASEKASASSSVAAPSLADIPETLELEIKAPNRHKNRLKLLSNMPKHGRCAEIGVWNGGFSSPIIRVTQPKELVLIDPWDLLADQAPGDWTHKKHGEAEEMRLMRENVEALYGALPNVNIRRGFSAEVLAEYPDNYFDWVYIDGNHLYEFVRRDVELSFLKVRPGGIIAGDDFFWKRDGRMHVKDGVLDAMRAQGMINRPTRFGQQFMITVPSWV